MAVRREVVSFSQLLQRRSIPQREREPSLSQSQASTSNASSGSQCSSSCHGASHAHGGVSCSSQRDMRHHRDDLHGLQPRAQPARTHCDHGSAFGSQGMTHSQAESCNARPWSQSQEETSWSGCMTSQSQSQTQTCMSQPPLPPAPPSTAPASQDERSFQVPLHQPRPFLQHSKFSKMLLESGKLSLETSKERARSEEEVLSRLVVPVNETLKEIKAMLAQQTKTQSQQTAVQAELGNEIQSIKNTMQHLKEQAAANRANCDDCHEKMGKEAAAARAAFESMGQRMGAMERNVDVFITNMTTFVREELFSLQIQRESGRSSSSFTSRARPAVKRRLVEQTPIMASRYAPLPCSTTPKNPRKRASNHRSDSIESRKPTSTERRRSQRILSRRQREEEEAARDENNTQESPGADDVFGIQLALARVEEARAKRRRQL